MIIRDNFLLILDKNICCDPSSETSPQDSSDEGSQHMVSMRKKKNCHQILLSRALRQFLLKYRVHFQILESGTLLFNP